MKIEYPLGVQLLLKIGGIGLIVLGLFIFKFAWKIEYLQILPIIFGLLFFAFGLICFSEGFNSIIIDSEGIMKKNLIRKIKIPKNRVKGYAEITYKTSKQKKYTQLIVFDSNGKRKIKCDKESYRDKYELLLKGIRSRFKRVGVEDISKVHKQRESLYRNIGKGFGIFIFILGLYQFIFFEMIPQDKFQELTGTLTFKPTIEEKRTKRIESARFQFEEYPEYTFKVVGEHFRLLNPLAKELNVGAKVKMKILKSDYQEKIEKRTTPNFINKHIDWNEINLYEISHNGKTMLSLVNINNSRSNPAPKILMMLFGVGFFVYYGYVSKGYD